MGESVPEPETPAKSLSLRRSVRKSVSIFILDPRVSCKIVLSVHARVFRIFTSSAPLVHYKTEGCPLRFHAVIWGNYRFNF